MEGGREGGREGEIDREKESVCVLSRCTKTFFYCN